MTTTTTKAYVLLNQTLGSFTGGYRLGDELRLAFTFEVERPGPGDACYVTLERVFDLGNQPAEVFDGEGSPRFAEQARDYRKAGNRSVSVGDVVVLEGFGAFKVARMGFEELAGDERAAAYALVDVAGEAAASEVFARWLNENTVDALYDAYYGSDADPGAPQYGDDF